MTLDEQIRDMASRGFSRQATMHALEIPEWSFRQMLDAMPDIEWPALGKSVDCKLYYERSRGMSSPARVAVLNRGRQTMQENRRIFNIGGVKLSLLEAIALYKEYVEVGRSTVQRRMHAGWSLYDAMFKPRQPSAVDAAPGVAKKRFREIARLGGPAV